MSVEDENWSKRSPRDVFPGEFEKVSTQDENSLLIRALETRNVYAVMVAMPRGMQTYVQAQSSLHVYEALQAELAASKELLREIRDSEVNAQDEADKFLRDHQPSELSKVRAQVVWHKGCEDKCGKELEQVKAELQQAREALKKAKDFVVHPHPFYSKSYVQVISAQIKDALSPQPPAQDYTQRTCPECGQECRAYHPQSGTFPPAPKSCADHQE